MKTSSRIARRRAVPGAAAALALLLMLGACSAYSFSGATIPPEYETIAIVPIAIETSTQDVSNLEDELTRLLTDRFVRRTRLRLETNENAADVVLSGRLTGYSDLPVAIASGDQGATRNEVTVRAEIQYRANANDSLLIDDTYTQAESYDLNAAPGQGAEAAALTAVQEIADAVFSAATSNW